MDLEGNGGGSRRKKSGKISLVSPSLRLRDAKTWLVDRDAQPGSGYEGSGTHARKSFLTQGPWSSEGSVIIPAYTEFHLNTTLSEFRQIAFETCPNDGSKVARHSRARQH